MIEYEKRAMIEAEDKYTFRQSTQISMQTGLIGHLRADMDTDGNGFFSSWFDFREELKTDEFKAEFDEVINSLREEGDILHNRRALAKYCYCTPQSRMQEEPGYYGVRVDTEKYAYLLRLNPDRGEYNLYCYCYRRDWLDQHLKDAEKGIRFIDSHYKELFRIPDGGKVKIHHSWNEDQIRTCRYIDDYHVEIGSNLYHICEFAERMEYALSLAEKARIDMPYMSQLTGKTEQELFEDLKGVIFLNPMHISEEDGKPKYLPADEYLSGNVREKLRWAKRSAELYPEDYGENIRALEAVQPVDLTASEISVRLGATWLPPEIIEEFMFELFSTPRYCQWNIHVHYAQYTGEWNVEGKSYDRSNVKAHNTYGTGRVNGYKIMEETLNLRDVRIFDYIEDGNGRKTAVLNKKETAIAQGKQELIKQAFADWIWSDPERRETLTKLYNEKFNSIRPREYDGSHLNFVGINPEITLRPHQVNAIAHILYGGNTLLAHVVGAGKTFEMVAAAQESKRLGLCQKSLFVVPNHLTEQWASEYLQLYPSANILVATKKDFEAKNRKKFCGRIATGDYDAVIIGHSQFEKIPMSIERQRAILQQQLDEVLDGISELKKNRGDNFSIKQLERTKKTVKQKLDKLNDQSRKDDVVTFEELGVDRIFIDEAHYYKNLAAFTKMRNVGNISQTEAMKSSDLYMKCRYLDELTGGRGVVFATGTPISNSMVEMYTMQKYLQYSTLKRNDLLHFDAWASTFGETVTAIELSPEGTGYRAKTRFAKFYNLPELMAMFKETADIQTADMLKLPVPEAHYHSVVLKPSETQKEMVASLSERAERVRNKMVDSSVDNMLLITNDGRKLALDQRLMNDMLPDSETSKVGACADNVFDIWQRTADRKSTQMVFCDLSTPHGDGKFNVYDDLRNMLDNRYALLFIRGERPIRDLKYDILHHPNVALTTDGSAPAYTHGEDTRSIASMAFSFDKKAVKNAEKMEAEKHEFLLYSEEELEELLDEKEKKGNEET